LDEQRQRGEAPNHAYPRYRIEACCFDSWVSVTSDAVEKVPTGGELTLFEAVGRWA
jgi:hypothetical protein